MLQLARRTAVFLTFFLPLAGALAGDPVEECNSEDDATKLRGCTALIKDGTHPAEVRAIALSRRSDAHLASGALDQAIVDRIEARKLEPAHAEHAVRLGDAYRLRGELLITRNEFDQGIHDFTEALSISADNHRALFGRGQAYLAKGDRDRALADFVAAARIDPTATDYTVAVARVYGERGREHLAQSRFDRAISDLDEAIRLDERNTALLLDRAAAHRGRKDAASALADYNSVLRIDPQLTAAYLQRAELQFSQGKYPEVITDCTEVLARNEKSYEALMLRGLAKEKIDQHDDAVRDYRAALAVAPADPLATGSLERATRTATTKAALARLDGDSAAPPPAVTPPARPAPDSGDGFTAYNNRDLEGGDLRHMKGLDRAACARACASDNDCRAFTYDKWNRWCFLKSQVGSMRLDPKYQSSFRKGHAAPDTSSAATVIERYRKKNFPQGQKISEQSAASYEECESRCDAGSDCVAFVYASKSRQCRLLSDADEYFSSTDTDSGVKRQAPSR
ncbi:MAG: tetratricopeptide repeat protein [Hyphomicrobium sp.]